MAAAGLVLDVHVGVKGDEGAVLEPADRVDLGERHVVFKKELGELREDWGELVQLAARDAGRGDRLLGLEAGDGQEVRDVAAADLVGLLLGDLLDIDSADGAEDHHRLLGRAVPDDPGVVLLLDLGLRIDQDAAGHVAADLQLEDVGGVAGGLVGAGGKLDAPGLHPPAAEHLALDHRLAADPLGGLACLLRGPREAEVGHRDPGAPHDLAGLELVEAHQSRP